MPRGMRSGPWIGKCGTAHFPKQKCKVCIANWQRKSRKNAPKPPGYREKYLKWARRNGLTGEEAGMRTLKAEAITKAHRKLANEFRDVLRQFIACFTFTKEGFQLYADQMPKLLALREKATRLSRTMVTKEGHIKKY